jgi:hypothetical protein
MMYLASRTKVLVFWGGARMEKVNDEMSLCVQYKRRRKAPDGILAVLCGFAYYYASCNPLKTHARQPYCSGGDCREEDMEAIMGYEGAPLMYRGRMRHKGE